MKRRILMIAALAIALGVSGSHGEMWKMRVHCGDKVDEFALSQIDSLTFYDAAATVPPTVTVPAGTFIMGDGVASCGEDEREVTLTRHFYLGQHEVTNQEYMESLQWAYDHGYASVGMSKVWDLLDDVPSEVLLDMTSQYCEIRFEEGSETFYLRESPSLQAQSAYPEGYDPADHPVKEVSWYGAARYCDWLSIQHGLPRSYEHTGDWVCHGGDPYGAVGYRLPTDAEWEYAAQCDDERIYPWGGEEPECDQVNFFRFVEYCVGWTTPVGSYPDAPPSLGLSDMAGNALEWCNDWHECDLGTTPETDPVGAGNGEGRVWHGGAWCSSHELLRCAYRGSATASTTDNSTGFRFARTVGP